MDKVTDAIKKVVALPTFDEKLADMGALKAKKNYDYANGGDEFGNFKRVAHFWEAYPGVRLDDPAIVAWSYLMKQVDAILWAKNVAYKGKVEGARAKYKDVSIYSMLADMIDAEAEAMGVQL